MEENWRSPYIDVALWIIRSVNDSADHLVTLVALLREAYSDAREYLGRAAERTMRYYDFKSRPTAFDPGDLVWLYPRSDS